SRCTLAGFELRATLARKGTGAGLKLLMKLASSVIVLLLSFANATQAGTILTKVAAHYQSLFIESDGSLWGMGSDNYGALGDGSFKDTNRPEKIVSGNVTAIAAGDAFTLFVKSDGSLWGMGGGGDGNLGDGTFNYTNRPEQIIS